MAADPNRPEVLLSISSEIEASAIVNALADRGVHAMAVGGYIAGFRAEAPSSVAVVVKLSDFERAKQALIEIQHEQAELDWSQVNVMERAELPASAEQTAAALRWRVVQHNRFWWTLELIGIALCLMLWVFTRQLTPPLVYTVTGLTLVGLFLSLAPFATPSPRQSPQP
ncbi:MAG: DUF2007 domain-containing protein [Planctomycetaceae bacterium]|nr:DUF2007 domain-containing protein [Planctomycetaceae bacterium]